MALHGDGLQNIFDGGGGDDDRHQQPVHGPRSDAVVLWVVRPTSITPVMIKHDARPASRRNLLMQENRPAIAAST